MKERVLFCWSGGKDSALALHALQQSEQYEVASLLTTVTADYERIAMHGVRRELLHAQAAALGIPLHEVFVPSSPSNTSYEACMGAAFEHWREAGVATVAFGDIFLEDLRVYREQQLARAGLRCLFPLWKQDSRELLATFFRLGFQGVTVCVDAKVLDVTFVGRVLDEQFLADLPAGVDPCGENGEFHTFVFAGPIFHEAVPVRIGEVVSRDSFFFCDLLPQGHAAARLIRN